MSYQRLQWHSGLTYRALCPACRAYMIYTDYELGFRSWYPNGFVYCARCRKPIRHNENNAINPDGTPYFPFPIRTPPPPGYVAYPIESLALNQPYPQQPYQQPAPPPYQQPYAQQPYAQQPYAQQPYQQPAPPYPQQPYQQPAPQQAPPVKKCPTCGQEYSDERMNYCNNCGTKLP